MGRLHSNIRLGLNNFEWDAFVTQPLVYSKSDHSANQIAAILTKANKLDAHAMWLFGTFFLKFPDPSDHTAARDHRSIVG